MLANAMYRLWFGQPSFPLSAVQYVIAANHSQGLRAVGGRFFLTDATIIFEPNRLDGWFGGKSIEIAVADLRRVTTVGPNYALKHAFSGGFYPRLCLEAKDGSQFLFVVGRLPEVVELLRSWLR